MSTESEKERLDALIKAGYRGSSKRLMEEYGFPQTIIQIYYMPMLRKYKKGRRGEAQPVA